MKQLWNAINILNRKTNRIENAIYEHFGIRCDENSQAINEELDGTLDIAEAINDLSNAVEELSEIVASLMEE